VALSAAPSGHDSFAPRGQPCHRSLSKSTIRFPSQGPAMVRVWALSSSQRLNCGRCSRRYSWLRRPARLREAEAQLSLLDELQGLKQPLCTPNDIHQIG
jgi:hypothetical protein